MPQDPCFKPVTIQPITGLLDVASEPNLVPLGGYRQLLNMHRDQDGRLRRSTGWERLFAEREPNNWDLHYQGDYTPQHFTFLYEAESPFGTTKLFAGTQNRIYSLNGESGNWRPISDQLGGAAQEGCPEIRFRGAHQGRFMFFTNGVDKPIYHVIGQGPEAQGQSVSLIPDFKRLKITRAKHVLSYNNMVIWMNLEMDGQWFPNRVLWSDLNFSLSYFPNAASLAGFFDLDDVDKILGAAHTKNSIMIYTTAANWEMSVAGGGGVFGFTRRWRSERAGGKGVLAYPNTLVGIGDTHYYFGTDSIYQYSPYISEPQVVEWVDNGVSNVFREIDRSRCNIHVGGYNDDTNELIWSWANRTDACPSSSIVINARDQFIAPLDFGFTAFVASNPDRPKTLRTVVKELCICTLEQLGSILRCGTETPATCEVTPNSFYSNTPLQDGDITVENHVGQPDADSLFTILGGQTLSDLCSEELSSDECNAEKVFIGASSADKCLKQFTGVLYRERCTSVEGCGTYVQVGYRSLMRSGALDLRLPDDDKIVNRFAIQPHPDPETIPPRIKLRIGMSAVAEDPNIAAGRCAILWTDEGEKLLQCMGGKTAEQHKLDGTRPNDELEWALYQIGRYIYYELEIFNPDTGDIGGAVGFSRLTFDVAAMPRR